MTRAHLFLLRSVTTGAVYKKTKLVASTPLRESIFIR
jgi:hypothetical protein